MERALWILVVVVIFFVGIYIGQIDSKPDNHTNTRDDYRDEEDEE